MPESIGREFMRKTSSYYRGLSNQDQGRPQPPLELPYSPDAPLIKLPDPSSLVLPQVDLRVLMEQRRTLRRYAEASLSLQELSYLLWCSQGVEKVTPRPATLRPVPSAGARHAFETYLLLNSVEGLAPALYRYIALKHSLMELDNSAQISKEVTHACYDQQHIQNSAATFIWVAVVERMTWRYPERGYRYLHLDAGHVCQNLYLAAESCGCGICAIAAFNDEELNRVLRLDGDELFVIYMASLGKKISGE
jgi:SagB-type dehydrogenase family enzyme